MATISGARNTGNILTDRLVVDMRDQIALLDPNEGPFVTFLKKAKADTRTVYNPKFEWLEDDLIGVYTEVATAISSNSTTSVVVDSAENIRPGDVILVSTEQMIVTAVSSNTLTVIRETGGTALASIPVDSPVRVIGKAYEENSTSPNVLSTKESVVYNYTQIFRTPIALSNTEDKAKLYGGKDRAYQRRKALIEHKRDIANAMYFGKKAMDTTGDAPRRTMGGLLSFLTQSQAFSEEGGGTPQLTYATFDEYVAQPAFRYGSKEKLLIAGPKLMTKINSWAIDDVLTDVSKDKTYGMRVKTLVTSYGDLQVIYDPLLAESGHADYGMVIDPENVRYCHLDGRDTKLKTNIQENDRDGIKDEYLTECSLEVRLPKTHMLLTGCY